MLTPLIFNNEELNNANNLITTEESAPSKTYKIDFEKGEIYPVFIDGTEAIKQAVKKAIKTIRDKYLIYSSDYGCEIYYLKGKSYSKEYLQIEVPRLIKEALMVDDRIEATENFIVDVIDDELHVSFEVVSIYGSSIPIEVVL